MNKSNVTYVFLVLLVIAITFFLLRSFQATSPIGVVNITGIVDQFIKTQAKENISAIELKKSVLVFGANLEKTLHELSNKKHVVLMPAEAVIAGATDYTPTVLKSLNVNK
jgi:hypothetical protein